MSNTPQPQRTKAYYKQQWQLMDSMKPCSVQLTRLSEKQIDHALVVGGKADSPHQPVNGATTVCRPMTSLISKPIKRSSSANLSLKSAKSTPAPKPTTKSAEKIFMVCPPSTNQPKRHVAKASTSKPTRRQPLIKPNPSLPKPIQMVVDTIVISSDDEPKTPPRRPPPVQDNPITLPPFVSPLSTTGDVGTDLPPTPGRSLFLEFGVPTTSSRCASDSDSEPQAPRINRRLESSRGEGGSRLPSLVVVPPPPPSTNEEISFHCREELSEDARRELQPCLREALRRRVGRQPYKRIFSVAGKKMRVIINRQGKVIVTSRPEGQSSAEGEVV